MMAGATPSALAAAVRLPRVATDTNDSKALSLSMGVDYGDNRHRECPGAGPVGRHPAARHRPHLKFENKFGPSACCKSAHSYYLYSNYASRDLRNPTVP